MTYIVPSNETSGIITGGEFRSLGWSAPSTDGHYVAVVKMGDYRPTCGKCDWRGLRYASAGPAIEAALHHLEIPEIPIGTHVSIDCPGIGSRGEIVGQVQRTGGAQSLYLVAIGNDVVRVHPYYLSYA